MSTYSKYADKYKARLRTRSSDIPAQNSFSQPPLQPLLSLNHRSTEPSPSRVQTLTPPRKTVDRNAYMSYLEIQLDKVTSACLTVQGFSERIEQVQSQINTHEDKLINMARLLKLQQTYSNGQEEEIRQLQDEVAQHSAKLNGTSLKKPSAPGPNKSKVERNSSGERDKENKIIESLLKRVEQLESKQLHESIRKPLAPVVSGKEQAIEIQNMLWREDMERKVNEALSSQGRDMSRDVSLLEEKVLSLQKELSLLRAEKEKEQSRSEMKELRISMSRDQPFQGGNESKQSQMQSAVNKWAEGVEMQVNKIQGKVDEMRREALMINQKVNEEIVDRRGKEEELRERTEAAEQLCNRLVDDSLKKAAGLEGRLSKVEASMLNKLRRMEERNESGEERRSVSKSPTTGVSGTKLKEELKRVEDLLTRKITNAVEKLGTLMKRYVKEQKRLVEKVETMDSTMTTIPTGKRSKETTIKTLITRSPKQLLNLVKVEQVRVARLRGETKQCRRVERH